MIIKEADLIKNHLTPDYLIRE